ncbi:type IV toxin-antitoxin system AbiEi family antitoxin domain-containing protein [Nocardioides jishulii]|uniref:AbiEi antitoxin N-terminal domain-containing protein n=1 Tax=Nocardioides jishulii TaxID=2575440 RepID=A0A4U2YSF3_9ACTN|nr:type IV toxin-antitoxin system AbiEi family antitoxin domain-containing protein [Nocardioides jishulii]QCX28651.1 hypothetical protein FCL41_14755 [Nocardioides jishulii]TKI64456.1 hypothetical protein FC770_04820 [Nocardioides jishulii]
MDWGDLAQRQDGVVSRRQLVELGLADHDVRRLVRRRDLTRVHLGVYVTHTGELSWRQRAWAAVLYAAPAALWGPSALVVERVRPEPPSGPVHVAVDELRRVDAVPGVVVHRVRRLDERARLHLSPPRIRIEHAVLDTAGAAVGEVERVAVLTDALQARAVTVPRLLATLEARPRMLRKSQLRALLQDLTEGTDSVLEHGYLVRVERPHGLPRGRRQAHVGGLRSRHDVVHEATRTIIELDGRAYHSLASQRYADLERDAAAAAAGHLTIRLGWGQVFSSPCTTAERLARVLRQRGWAGSLRRCPQCP